MTLRAGLALCVVTLAVSGCSSMHGGPFGPVAANPGAPAAAEFVSQADVSDTFEIQTSQVALQTTRDPRIRRFARRMIADHTRTSRNLMAAAQRAGLPPQPPMLDGPHQAMFNQLRSTPPEAFDGTYVSMQVQSHQEAVQLHSSYASAGDNPVLMDTARRTLPIVQMHLQDAQALASGAPAAGAM